MIHAGRCHCGQVRFRVAATIDHARVCNCSVCTMRGALNFRVPDKALLLETPLSALSCYVWGSGTARDYFCPACGILPFRRPSAPTSAELARGVQPFDGWAVNLRCLPDLDIEALPRVDIDGRSI